MCQRTLTPLTLRHTHTSPQPHLSHGTESHLPQLTMVTPLTLNTPTSHLTMVTPLIPHHSHLSHLTTLTPHHGHTSHTSQHPHPSHLITSPPLIPTSHLTTHHSHISPLTPLLTQLDLSVISQENVGSFDVSMHLVLGMEVV